MGPCIRFFSVPHRCLPGHRESQKARQWHLLFCKSPRIRMHCLMGSSVLSCPVLCRVTKPSQCTICGHTTVLPSPASATSQLCPLDQREASEELPSRADRQSHTARDKQEDQAGSLWSWGPSLHCRKNVVRAASYTPHSPSQPWVEESQMGITEKVLSHPRTFLGTCRNSMPLPKPGQGTGPGRKQKAPVRSGDPGLGGSSW